MNSVRLLAIIAVGFALQAQTPPVDVSGWDKIKWGMTISDARSAYKIEVKPQSADGWKLLTLPSVTFAGVKMDAQAAARQESEKITSVRLWSYFGLANSTPGSGAQDFETLKAALIAKYGPAGSEDTAHGENFRLLKSVRWTFPSSSMLLTLEQSSSLPNLGNITLEFTARNR